MSIVLNVDSNTLTLAVAGLAAVLVLYAYTSRKASLERLRLPPGPPPSLLTTKLPSHMWLWFDSLSKEYGPVITVWLGKTPFIIACSLESANELMERKSAFTSDRPKQVLAGEVLSGNLRTGVVGYNDKWRRLRKALHTNLTVQKATTYQPRQIIASHQVLKDILDKPDNFRNAIRSYAASVIMSVGYSKQTRSTYQDDEIRKVVECLNRFHDAAQPGHFAIDTYPWLRYVPGYLSQHQTWHKEELQLFREQMDRVKDGLKSGSPDIQACFASYILENQKQLQLNDDEAAYLAGSLFGAGSDTTVAALMVVMLAAAAHPEQVAIVQAEMDRVVGTERPPNFDDWEELPQTWAFVLESYRWRPILPAGLAHGVTETFEYNGYIIPKGAIITGNHWSIHRDPAMFKDPESFDPSRWLLVDGEGRKRIDKTKKHVQFGFGRRICAGSLVADRSVFLNSSCILHSFTITPSLDSAGKPIPLNLDPKAFDDAVTSHPLPFKVDFKPRLPGTEAMIRGLEAFPS